MKQWNMILTSFRNERDYLLKELENYPGTFRSAEFRDVVLGYVKDQREFLEVVNENYIPSLSRAIPLTSTFQFEKETFKDRVKEAIKPLIEEIGEDETFAVRCERRGFKDTFSSQKIEREIGSYIWEQLEKRGISPEVELEDPDRLVIIEMVGAKAGVALIERTLREKYEFLSL